MLSRSMQRGLKLMVGLGDSHRCIGLGPYNICKPGEELKPTILVATLHYADAQPSMSTGKEEASLANSFQVATLGAPTPTCCPKFTTLTVRA